MTTTVTGGPRPDQDVRPTSWGGQKVLVPRVSQTHCLSIHPCPSMPQGVISAVKELDYEISNGRYTLLVTATDQCPILSHRLTSTTTVGGGTQPQLGSGGRTWPRKLQWGREIRKDCPEEMPESKSLALVLATHPNLLCDFEEVTVSLLCHCISQIYDTCLPPLHGKSTESRQTNRVS